MVNWKTHPHISLSDDGVDGRLETSRYPQDQYGKVNSYNGYVSEQVELPDEFPDESIEGKMLFKKKKFMCLIKSKISIFPWCGQIGKDLAT